MPARIANAPQLLPGLDFFYIAFLELSTCRDVGMGLGPIPWTAMNAYAERYGLEDDDFAEFTWLLKRLDATYLQQQDEKRKAEAAANKKTR